MRSMSMTRCIEFSADSVLAVNSMEIESRGFAMILNPPLLPVSQPSPGGEGACGAGG
jgi:hypothetical protein